MKFSARKVKWVVLGAAYVLALMGSSVWRMPHAAALFDIVTLLSKPVAQTTQNSAKFTFTDMNFSPLECQLDGAGFSPCTSPYTTPSLADGSHTFSVHAIGGTNPESTASYTWGVNALPVFAGGSGVSGTVTTPIAISDLQVSDSGNETLTLELHAPSGTLAMATTTGLTFTGSPTGASLKFSGTRTNLNAALATLTYTPSASGSLTINVFIDGQDGQIYNMLNGHAYKVVDAGSPGLDWADAKTAADASTYGGVSGYLATVTSSAEDAFIQAMLPGTAWMGASDAANEGDWKWVDGPESGTSFWSGGVGGTTVGGLYAGWQGGQPDNFNGTENCSEMRVSTPSSWNDQSCASLRQFYIVEYGDGSTIPYMATTQISVTSSPDGDPDGDGLNNSIETQGPNHGDTNNDGTADMLQANVTTQPSPTSNTYVTVQTSCTANLGVEVGSEAPSHKDASYDYPFGLVGFIGTGCGAPGSSVTVTQYYFGTADLTKLALRKWDTTHDTYSTISGAVLSAVTIGGQPAIKVVYQVVDGGPLDQDHVADGNIRDPVGLGLSVVGAPNTGQALQTSPPYAFMLLGGALPIAAAILLQRRRLTK
ncbi:MAG TPA: choice-of-anchor U domain-containing protein [Candidatus Saccharimonadales bacterium]|nr:choice-of-anchor U domain-containing protein [Candidatus Saccharimonadales bacterium]